MKRPLPSAQSGRVLVDSVSDSLREAILHGYFHSGEKLDQDGIARELDVSRTPVREAVRRLASEGFIELRPHRGAYIVLVTRDDILELYELRGLLEAEVARQVALLVPDETLDDLSRAVSEAQVQVEAGDIAAHFACDARFHRTLLDSTRSKLLKEALDGLNNRTSMVRHFARQQPNVALLKALAEHRGILSSIYAHDPDAAARQMRLHWDHSALRLVECL